MEVVLLTPACTAPLLFPCRNRNTFFELVSKGEYNWNVKAHRDMCR